MRNALEDLLDDLTLMRLALGIALGWALFRVADGAATTVTTTLTDFGPQTYSAHSFTGEPLTWYVGDRILTFGKLLQGVLALAVVLVTAILVERRRKV
jgi:hypothetical protein